MDRAAAEVEVRRLASEWVAQVRAALEAGRQANGLQKILSGYCEMFPDLAAVAEEVSGAPIPSFTDDDAPAPGVPRGAEAVRIVLQEMPKVHWYVSEMVENLRDRGWLPDSDNPANAVRAALDRLASSDESDVYKVHYTDRTVRYVYDPDRERGSTPNEPPYGDEEPF
jgi:hypothetical protein